MHDLIRIKGLWLPEYDGKEQHFMAVDGAGGDDSSGAATAAADGGGGAGGGSSGGREERPIAQEALLPQPKGMGHQALPPLKNPPALPPLEGVTKLSPITSPSALPPLNRPPVLTRGGSHAKVVPAPTGRARKSWFCYYRQEETLSYVLISYDLCRT